MSLVSSWTEHELKHFEDGTLKLMHSMDKMPMPNLLSMLSSGEAMLPALQKSPRFAVAMLSKVATALQPLLEHKVHSLLVKTWKADGRPLYISREVPRAGALPTYHLRVLRKLPKKGAGWEEEKKGKAYVDPGDLPDPQPRDVIGSISIHLATAHDEHCLQSKYIQPSDYPPSWDSRAGQLVRLELQLHFEIKFGKVERFVVQFKSNSCLAPNIDRIQIKNIKFIAQCIVWWDVLGHKVSIAFCKGVTVDWDVAIVTCGMAWPDLLEDRIPAAILRIILEQHNITNPLIIDLEANSEAHPKAEDSLSDDATRHPSRPSSPCPSAPSSPSAPSITPSSPMSRTAIPAVLSSTKDPSAPKLSATSDTSANNGFVSVAPFVWAPATPGTKKEGTANLGRANLSARAMTESSKLTA
mmetsp:Transcript_6830/g.15385  ORF Transcript_6830/g.15385 Transcript_6830/m.15385 type:complete len:412 (-) Transcript_6830:128-1363(-)